MQIFVQGLDGETFIVETVEHTVDEVKQHIEDIEGVPVGLQRLVFEGKELQQGHQLAHYNVQQQSTLHLTMDLDGGGYAPWPLQVLAMWHLVNKQICRKCYGRLSPAATRCGKAKCGRTSDIRPKKPFVRSDSRFFSKKFTPATYLRAVNKLGYF